MQCVNLQTIDTIEYGADCDEDYYCAVQDAINNGLWKFQGSYGRTMMDAITSGYCMLGRQSFKDYWGNTIPSRADVQEGTKGSYQYVAEIRGEAWAEMIANVGFAEVQS